MVATDGWAEKSDMEVIDLARRFEDAGVAALLFTDVGRDGMMKGCNIEATVDLARRVDIPVIASGGVKGIADIRMLALQADQGIEGVITGRAIYDGRLDLTTAIAIGAGGVSLPKILPGTGRGTARRSRGVEGHVRQISHSREGHLCFNDRLSSNRLVRVARIARLPLHHAAHGPPPRSGEDL